ncbi:hypothetical protein BH09SUM1_BH09SUM1_32650 [soil metagenome]
MQQIFKLSRDAHVEIEEVRFRVGQLTAGDASEVVLDMEEVLILDSMLLGQIVRMVLALKAIGISMRLANLTSHSRIVVHHANLDSMFGLQTLEPPQWDSGSVTVM